jgi:hypothetical protein
LTSLSCTLLKMRRCSSRLRDTDCACANMSSTCTGRWQWACMWAAVREQQRGGVMFWVSGCRAAGCDDRPSCRVIVTARVDRTLHSGCSEMLSHCPTACMCSQALLLASAPRSRSWLTS